MRYRAPGADPGILDLGVGADVHPIRQLCPRPQAAEGPHGDLRSDLGFLQVGALDPRAVADGRIAQLRQRTDDAILADHAGPGNRREGVDHRVLADRDVGIDKGCRGVCDGDAADHQGIEDPLTHHVLGLGELPPVVDAEDLVAILHRHRRDLPLDQPDDVGQVVLARPVLVFELQQGRPELAATEDIDAGVDLRDRPLFIGGVFFLDDVPEHAIAPTDDTAVAVRIFKRRRQQRDGRARLAVPGEDCLERLASKQRRVGVEDDHRPRRPVCRRDLG